MLDLDQTRRFLRTLSLAPGDDVFAFQTVDDPEGEDLPHLRRVLIGDFESQKELLKTANSNRAGIFATVNRTNGLGRKEADIVGLRAAFVDSDSGPIELNKYLIEPNIIVNSKNGQHAYWLLKQGEDRAKFWGLQRALSKFFGSDPSVHDLPRVMRLPGFLHHKTDPFLVTLEKCDSQPRVSVDELVEAFSLVIEYPEEIERKGPSKSIDQYENKLERCEAYLRKNPDYDGVSAERNNACYKIASICFDFALSEDQARSLLDRWNARNSPPLSGREIDRVLRNAIKHRKKAIGAKLDRPDFGGPADEIPPERSNWHTYDGAKSADHSIIIDPPKEDPPEDRPGWENDLAGFGDEGNDPEPEYEKNIREQTQINKSQDDDRIGLHPDFIFDDKVFPYSDIKRKPPVIHSTIIKEYNIRKIRTKEVFIYSKNRWCPISEDFIAKLAGQYTTHGDAKMKNLNEVAKRTLSRVLIDRIEWNQLKETEVALKDGILDFVTGEIRGHDPKDYLDRYIPYEYDKKSKCPTWEAALEDWLPGGEQEKRALQQFFGYILMPTARYKKALILFGGPNTGKSQICKVAEELVGGMNFTCSISPEHMNDPRLRAPIKGKALNIIVDLPKNTTLADGGFKQLVSTEETISIDQKYYAPEQYTPTCKHIFATNNLPHISDTTDAVYKRLLIIRFLNEIPAEKQDTFLFKKLKKEMPGILNWAVKGARDLYSSGGKWPIVDSSEEMIEEYKQTQNPLHDFIEESDWIIQDKEGSISVEKLRDLFNAYHKTRPWTKKAIREKISALGFLPTRVGTKRGVQGLRINPKYDDDSKQEELPNMGNVRSIKYKKRY